MRYSVLYHGFDGLEFAIMANIPKALSDELAEAKSMAAEFKTASTVTRGPIHLSVRETGARGGYTYSCSEVETGNWFFKKPSISDPWGIRFSASSAALAVHGLEGVRERVRHLLSSFEIYAPDSAFNISRADFAVDFMAPDFRLAPNNFVMHSRLSRKSIDLIEHIEANGRSNRTTSVTVGKMPNRQAIIYDKREEVLVKGKWEWPVIWARSLHGPTAPPLDIRRQDLIPIWRIEIRVAKRHLKDVWGVKGWESFYRLLPEIYAKLLSDIRYCSPSNDENRARWPSHPMWRTVDELVNTQLFEFLPNLAPEEYVEIKRDQKVCELHNQIVGLAISAAGIEGINNGDLRNYLAQIGKNIQHVIPSNNDVPKTKLDRATGRYAYLRE